MIRVKGVRQLLEKFDINGAVIEFSEEKVRYNSIRKKFASKANSLRNSFKEECIGRYTSKNLNEIGLSLGEKYINECIKKAVETIVAYGIITIDIYLFKQNYCAKYLNYYKSFKTLSREILNQNKGKKMSMAQKSIEDKKYIEALSEYIYEDCFKIHYAVIDALLDNKVNIVSKYIDEEQIVKSNALFNNYKDGFIDKTNECFVIKQIINLNPYRQDIYEFFIKEDGDFNKEIDRLTKFLGFDISSYKNKLMDDYFKYISKNLSYEVEFEKERLEKYAKYIGCENPNIYTARLDGLYTFQNA